MKKQENLKELMQITNIEIEPIELLKVRGGKKEVEKQQVPGCLIGENICFTLASL